MGTFSNASIQPAKLLSLHNVSAWSFAVAVVLPVLWIFYDYSRVLRLRRRLPPGPFPYPIVGNIGTVPALNQHLVFEEWGKKYNSPMLTVWTGSNPTVIINDIWVANELLDKRAGKYSSRPHMVLVGDMLDETTTNQTSLPYGDQWRLHRRIMAAAVGSQSSRAHRLFQEKESRVMALDILENPSDYVNAIERYATSVAAIVGWGRRISHKKDYLLGVALSFVQTGASFGAPAQHLVESWPWMTKLPSWMYPLPAILQQEGQKTMKYFYALVLEGSKGDANCFAKRLVHEQQQESLNWKEMATLTGNLIGGGVDTTATSTLSFIFAMCTHPEVQRKAHEELDRVIPGKDRLPDWHDEHSLPYITAVMQELFRWRAAIPSGGPPHAPIEDDIYNGFLIPKGTTMYSNVWAMHRNPRDYPSPDEFKPERFLDKEQIRPNPYKKGYATFGFGRRACSGQPLAEQGVWFTIAELLWAYEMKSVDDQGNDMKLDIFAYDTGLTSRPLPFRVEFKPRFPQTERIIRAEAKRALSELEPFKWETKVTMENADELIAAYDHSAVKGYAG